MKRSKVIVAPLIITTAALVLGGCSRSYQTRRCVDASGQLMSDSYCERTGYVPTSGYVGYPHWIYGGSSYMNGGHSYYRGYSSTPSSGADIVDGGGHSVSRGGFGSSGSSSSGS